MFFSPSRTWRSGGSGVGQSFLFIEKSSIRASKVRKLLKRAFDDLQ